MTELMIMIDKLGLQPEESLDDRWVKLRGEQCAVYIVEADWGNSYYTWCDAPEARVVERYTDAATAIQAGLRRAADINSRGSTASARVKAK